MLDELTAALFDECEDADVRIRRHRYITGGVPHIVVQANRYIAKTRERDAKRYSISYEYPEHEAVYMAPGAPASIGRRLGRQLTLAETQVAANAERE